jgi:uncharacterized protein GlcG (DUF336 family)
LAFAALATLGIATATTFPATAQQPAAQPASPPQQATPPYGNPISLEQAKKVIAAAESEAEKNKWFVAIAVVDSGGSLVAMHRIDNTQLGSISYAEQKARSAVLYRRPSKAFEDAVANGGTGCGHEKMMAAHLDSLRKLKATVEPLYAALSADQKKIADELMVGPMGMMGMGMM